VAAAGVVPVTGPGDQPPGRFPGAPDDAGLGSAYAVNAAWNALTYVRHPQLRLDVVSLGLVYDVRSEYGRIVVEMTLAGRGDTAPVPLPDMAETVVAGAVGGAAVVEVRVVRDPPWSPAMIDEIAAAAAGLRIT
jgi:metal-sulfur cluster biosynthetic enzyme